jgi:diguanylate cyclase (GGDEF)-like protein/PAS domain S-box-containing protein
MSGDTMTILYVEDDPEIRENTQYPLKRLCSELYVAEDGVKGLELYKESQPDIVVSDIKMPNMNGIDMVKNIKALNPAQRVVFTTAHNESGFFMESIEMQVNGYVLKPLDYDQLTHKIKELREQILNQRRVDQLNQEIHDQKEYFTNMMDSASDAIFVMSSQTGKILDANQMTCKLLGYTHEELLALDINDWDKSITDEDYTALMNQLSTEESMTIERTHTRKDGTTYEASISAKFFLHNDQKYLFASTRDVTEEKQLKAMLQRQKNELNTIFDASIDPIVIINLSLTFVRFNQSFQKLMGYEEKDILGMTCIDYSLPADEERLREAVREVMDKRSIVDFEQQCITKSGEVIHVNKSMALLPDEEHIVISIHDVTENQKREREIKRYVSLVNDYIITSHTDLKGKITYASNAFVTISGYSKEELIGNDHKIVRHPDMSSEFFEKLWSTIESDNIWRGEIKNRDKNGGSYWVDSVIAPKYDDQGIKVGYTAIRQDITDKKRVEELAITDGLTGIYNRRFFNQVIQEEIEEAKRRQKRLLFIIMDIDHFKLYNDTYGHHKGDEVIKAVATVIKNQLLNQGEYSFRLGGEEFAVLSRCENIEGAMEIAESIRRNIEELKILHEKNSASDYVTVSVGVVCKDMLNIQSNDAIYIEADELLYKAKESGRNRVVLNQ